MAPARLRASNAKRSNQGKLTRMSYNFSYLSFPQLPRVVHSPIQASSDAVVQLYLAVEQIASE